MLKWAKDPNRHLITEGIQMEKKHMKTPSVFWKLQIKAMKYHYTPIRMAKSKTLLYIQMLAGVWSNANSHSVDVQTTGGYTNSTAALEN